MLGLRIRMIRKKANMSQQDLAKGIISISHLSNLEADRYKASNETIELLAKALKVNSNYLTNHSKDHLLLRDTLMNLQHEIMLNQENVDQIIKDIKLPIENIELEVCYYLLKAAYFFKINQFDQAIEINTHFISYYSSFLEKSLETLPILLKSSTLYYFGIRNYRENNLSESNQYYKKLLEITSDNRLKAKLLYNLALINYNQSNRLEAFENANHALQLYIDLQQWSEIGELYNFIGEIYREASSLDNALLFFQKALSISKQMNLKNIEARIHHNTGLVLEDMGDFENAIKNFKLSYDLKTDTNHRSNLFITIRCLIRCYIKNNNINIAKQLTRESLTIIENQKQYHILKALEAEIHHIENDYDLFLTKMVQSINYLTKHHYFKEVMDLSSKVADYYMKQKKYKSAAFYYKQELEIKTKLKKG